MNARQLIQAAALLHERDKSARGMFRELGREAAKGFDGHLADHILATVREDDDDLVDSKWFRGLTGDGHMLELSEGRHLVLYTHGLSINDSAHSVDLHEIKTRGEFRALCRLLGVTLTESPANRTVTLGGVPAQTG